MGKYDTQIENSKRMLAEAEREYSDAVVQMADAATHVREFVLNTRRQKIEEARAMIVTFEEAND